MSTTAPHATSDASLAREPIESPAVAARMEDDRAVLIVDDDIPIARRIERELATLGYAVTTVDTARETEMVVQQRNFGVILLDLTLPDSSDLSLFHRLRAQLPRTRVIVMTAMDDLDVVIGATRAGAFDFITKSKDLMQRVVVTVRNAFDALAQADQVAELSNSLQRRDRFARLIAQSPQMDEVKEAIDKLAPSRVNVLITGQSGTGKEVVARTIHESGPRAMQPFVAVNCAGIPDTLLESELFGFERGAFTGAVARKIGKFEAAHGGTLFLDEIGEMSLSLQAKLLRVLQDGRFERLGGNQVVQANVRIICATNRDLTAMVRAGTFREDLYYRIAVFSLHLPALSARRGDIPLLVSHFTQQAARDEGKSIRGVSPEVMRLFELHSWPGNVRQLQNVLVRAAVVCTTDQISLRDLPESFVQELQLGQRAATLASDNLTPPRGILLPSPLEVPSHPIQPVELPAGPVPTSAAPPQRWSSGTSDERLDAALDLAFPDADLLPTVDDLEAAGLRLGLRRLGNNMQETARRLGMSRATLYRRVNDQLRGP